jgi:SnoaL-like protein
MTDSLGRNLIETAASRDFNGAGALLAPDVEFRALTPKKFVEANGPREVTKVLEEWFAPTQEIEAIESHTVVDRPAVRYRVRWSSPEEGTFVFEQQAYYDVADGHITRIHIVCSGARSIEAESE